MGGFFRFRGMLFGHNFTDALKNSFTAAWESLPFHSEESLSDAERLRHRGIVSAIRMVLSDASGELIPAKLETLRRLMDGERSPEEVERQLGELKTLVPLPPDDIAQTVGAMSDGERRQLLRFLLSLAAAAETPDTVVTSLENIFARSGVPEEAFSSLRAETLREEEHRRRVIGSGAGIVAALVVLAVFVITATLLRSVIFGLIVAYVLLPVEKYFEHRQRRRSGIAYHLFRIIMLPTLPLRKLSRRIMRHSSGGGEVDDKSVERRQERVIISQAVTQTVLLSVILLCGVFMILSRLTANYMGGLDSLRNQAAAVVAPAKPDKEDAQLEETEGEYLCSGIIARMEERLDQLRIRLERMPVVKFALDQIVLVLRDEGARKELIGTLLKTGGGIFHFTAGLLGAVVAFACDVLLTVFFALLFLIKLAEFCRDDESRGRKSEYLVRTVFNGHWLPDANEVTVGEAKRIVGGIMERLRVWVRGYLTLVLVDATVYTTLFFLLKVPYFPLLGILAGCGILLPYVGPVLSASVTILVTLAVGGSTGAQLAGIIAAYLLYNGVVEQFILYPAVIGESLGLTTLETIVVVLLGAVFAGIPGMVLALPAASVLKYLIPQIHHYLRMRRSDGE